MVGSTPYNTTTVPALTSTAGKSFEYYFALSLFYDAENDSNLLQYTISSLPDASAWLNINTGSRRIYGTPPISTPPGIFVVTLKAKDLDGNEGSTVFNLQVVLNQVPVILSAPASPACFFSHNNLNYAIPLSTHFSDAENEYLQFHMVKNPNTYQSAWLYSFNNSTHLVVAGYPVNDQSGNITVTVTVDDGHNRTANPIFTFQACVIGNDKPVLVGTPLPMPDVAVGQSFTYQFQKSWVSDPEGDPITFSTEINPNNGWVVFTDYPTYIEMVAAPSQNWQALNYNVKFKFTDPMNYVPNFDSHDFVVSPNQQIVAGTLPAEIEVWTPQGKTWSFGSGFFTDPEGLPMTKEIKVNGNPVIPAWLTYDLNTYDFSVAATSNAITGTYYIELTANDGFNPTVYKSFLFKILQVKL